MRLGVRDSARITQFQRTVVFETLSLQSTNIRVFTFLKSEREQRSKATRRNFEYSNRSEDQTQHVRFRDKRRTKIAP